MRRSVRPPNRRLARARATPSPAASRASRSEARSEGRPQFPDAEAAEEAQLDHLRTARIDFRQALECIVKRADRGRRIASRRPGSDRDRRLMNDSTRTASPPRFAACPGSRRVDQDAPHDLRRQREKMHAILPIHVLASESDADRPRGPAPCSAASCRNARDAGGVAPAPAAARTPAASAAPMRPRLPGARL